MSKFFDLVEDRVVINPQTLLVHPYSKIWERDKSKDKSKAFKELQYVYFLLDFDSPYIELEESDRIKQIKEFSIQDKDFKTDKLIEEAIEHYKNAKVTPAMRMLEAATTVIKKMELYFKAVDFTEKDEQGKLIYDIKEVTDVVTKLPKLTESLNQAKELCKKELSSTNRVRGGADVGIFE